METINTLEEWLQSIGVDSSIIVSVCEALRGEEIFAPKDVVSLTENDLKDLGLKLGTRKKIWEAILVEKEKNEAKPNPRSLSPGLEEPKSPSNLISREPSIGDSQIMFGKSQDLSPLSTSRTITEKSFGMTRSSSSDSLSSLPKDYVSPRLSEFWETRSTSSRDSMPILDDVSERTRREKFRPLGTVYKAGIFFNDQVELFSNYEAHLSQKRNHPDKKVVETFSRALLTKMASTEPTLLTELPKARDVSSSDSLFGVVGDDGNIYMMGAKGLHASTLGQSKEHTHSLVKLRSTSILPENDRFSEIKCGPLHTLALTEQGRLYSWGYNINCSVIGIKGEENRQLLSSTSPKYEFSGQLGRGEGLFEEPGQISGVRGDIIGIAAGGVHSAAVNTNGRVYTWGLNHEGQLGHRIKGSMKDYSVAPKMVKELKNVKVIKVACGGHHTLALTGTGWLFGWGFNRSGQCGVGKQECIFTPTRITGLLAQAHVSEIACGNTHSMALGADGKIFSWGSNDYGELGRKGKTEEPGEIETIAGIFVTKISCGANMSACVNAKGMAYIWGRFAGEKFTGHQSTPRLMKSSVGDLYVMNVICGVTHFAFLVNPEYSENIRFLKSLSSEETPAEKKLSEIPTEMYAHLQNRALQLMHDVDAKKYPLIQIDRLVINIRFKSKSTMEAAKFTVYNMGVRSANINFIPCTIPKVVIEPSKFKLKAGKSQSVNLSVVMKEVIPTEKTVFLPFTCEREAKSPVKGFLHLRISPESGKTPTTPRIRSNSGSSKSAPKISVDQSEVVLYERLGSGGSGAVVYRCTVGGFSCAVKILPLKETSDYNMKNFVEEVGFLESLNHENVVKYLGHDQIEDKIRLFMEFYPCSLSDLTNRRKGKGSLTPKEILRTAIGIARGLVYLHETLPFPIVHRDLKTGNVLLALDEEEMIKLVKITDFDIAKRITENSEPKTLVGTPAFTAPEVYKGKQKPYNQQADIWSFGMILVEMVTFKSPYCDYSQFEVPDLVQSGVIPKLDDFNIPPELNNIVKLMQKCIVVNPDERPTASGLLKELESM